MQHRTQNTVIKLGLFDLFFKSPLVPDIMAGVATHDPTRDLIAQAVRY